MMERREILSAAGALGVSDPLTEYIQSLGGSDRFAFFVAFMGPPSAENALTAETPDQPYTPLTATDGCRQEGYKAAPNVLDGFASWPQGMQQEFSSISATVAADPAVESARAAWSACMSESGWVARNREEARQLVAANIPVNGMRTVTYQQTPESPAIEVEIPSFDQGLLQATIDREILVATADLNCSESTGFDLQRERATNEAQRSFVDRWAFVLS